MSKKVKFTAEDEEKIIDFVKTNEILYNVKHKKFRDSEAKNRLWLKLATDMNMSSDGSYFNIILSIECFIYWYHYNYIVEAVKKKWTTMRDYFIRSKEKKTTGSAASSTAAKRDESLAFLLQTSILKRA